jgi:hypothetical protein
LYIVAAADSAGAEAAADDAAEAGALEALGDDDAPVVHAVARMAMAATPASHRIALDALVIRSPPLQTTRRSGRVDDLSSPTRTGSRSMGSMDGTSCA